MLVPPVAWYLSCPGNPSVHLHSSGGLRDIWKEQTHLALYVNKWRFDSRQGLYDDRIYFRTFIMGAKRYTVAEDVLGSG